MTKLEQHIRDYTDTMNEYINKTHLLNISTCVKCKTAGVIDSYDSCFKCPEYIFKSQLTAGCQNRITYAINNTNENYDIIVIDIIEYHKQAITYLKSIKRFNMKQFRNELIRIDNQFKNHD